MFQIVVKFIVPDHPHLNCLKVGEKHALPKFWWKVKMDFIIIMRSVSYAVVQGGSQLCAGSESYREICTVLSEAVTEPRSLPCPESMQMGDLGNTDVWF